MFRHISDEEPIDTIRASLLFFTAKRDNQPTPGSTELTKDLLIAIANYLPTNPDRSNLSFAEKAKLALLCRWESERKTALHFQALLQNSNDDEAVKLIYPELTRGRLKEHPLATSLFKVLKKHYEVGTNVGLARKIASEFYTDYQIQKYIQQYQEAYVAAAGAGMYGAPPVSFVDQALEELARSSLKMNMPSIKQPHVVTLDLTP